MRFARPKLPRTQTEPARAYGIAVPVREQTLRTLQMLKGMGYREVWVKSDEVDERTIDLAYIDGWRVCDAQAERIKFTLRPQTPTHAPKDFSPVEADAYRRASVRTMSPTRLTEPRPDPVARYRRASETNATAPEDATRRQHALIDWGRHPGEAVLEPPRTPSVVVSPPAPDDAHNASDYFAFVPVHVDDLDDFVPPQGSWLDRRRPRRPSIVTRPSLESVVESSFEFDETEPFAAAYVPRPSAQAAQPPVSLRQAFRPRTPELRIPTEPRKRAGSVQIDQGLTVERPTYRLTRMASDPGPDTEAQAPDFELLPLLPPRWRCRDT